MTGLVTSEPAVRIVLGHAIRKTCGENNGRRFRLLDQACRLDVTCFQIYANRDWPQQFAL